MFSGISLSGSQKSRFFYLYRVFEPALKHIKGLKDYSPFFFEQFNNMNKACILRVHMYITGNLERNYIERTCTCTYLILVISLFSSNSCM